MGVSRRKVDIFWGRDDLPYGDHDILAVTQQGKTGLFRHDVTRFLILLAFSITDHKIDL